MRHKSDVHQNNINININRATNTSSRFFHEGERNPQQNIRDKTSQWAIIPLVKTPVGILLLFRQSGLPFCNF